jgi:hypothetical protein
MRFRLGRQAFGVGDVEGARGSQRTAPLEERDVRIARFGAIHENSLLATVREKTSRLLRWIVEAATCGEE